MSQPTYIVTTEQQATVVTSPTGAAQGPPGPPGATGPNEVSDATPVIVSDEATPSAVAVLNAAGNRLATFAAPPNDGQTYSLTCTDGVLAWAVVSGADPYSPSLDFSDGRNSQYALFPLLVW